MNHVDLFVNSEKGAKMPFGCLCKSCRLRILIITIKLNNHKTALTTVEESMHK